MPGTYCTVIYSTLYGERVNAEASNTVHVLCTRPCEVQHWEGRGRRAAQSLSIGVSSHLVSSRLVPSRITDNFRAGDSEDRGRAAISEVAFAAVCLTDARLSGFSSAYILVLYCMYK